MVRQERMSAPMIEVRRIILRDVSLPLVEPFRIASGTTVEKRFLLVQLVDASGAVAFGECVADETPNYSAETVDTARLMIERFVAPRLVGRRLADPAQAAPILAKDFLGHPMAKAAVEMAIWCLAATLRGESLSRLLGGERDRVPVGISLGIQDSPEALVERARRARAAGYRRIKLKIMPEKDLDYVAAVRQALGPDVLLSVDANGSYAATDFDHLVGLDRFDLLMIEQPLRSGDLVGHAALQRRLRTPICLDESIVAVHDVDDMLTLGSGRLVNIKPGRVGGLASALAIHDRCRTAGMANWCGGMLESGIGRAYNVALASLPNFSLPGDISPSARYWRRDVVTPEWTMDSEGFVAVPRGPGLGVEVDVARIEESTISRSSLV